MTFVWEDTTAEDRQFIESLQIRNPCAPGLIYPPRAWAVSRATKQAVLMLGGGLRGEMPFFWMLLDGSDHSTAEGTEYLPGPPPPPKTSRFRIDRVFIPVRLHARRSADGVLAAFHAGLTEYRNAELPGGLVQFPGTPQIIVTER